MVQKTVQTILKIEEKFPTNAINEVPIKFTSRIDIPFEFGHAHHKQINNKGTRGKIYVEDDDELTEMSISYRIGVNGHFVIFGSIFDSLRENYECDEMSDPDFSKKSMNSNKILMNAILYVAKTLDCSYIEATGDMSWILEGLKKIQDSFNYTKTEVSLRDDTEK